MDKEADTFRCRYRDCTEQHPVARGRQAITCPSCRAVLGLPVPVIVVWATSLENAREGVVSILSFSGGAPRVFDHGETDPRCGETRFAKDGETFFKLLRDPDKIGSSHAIELPLHVARRLGLL